MDDPGITLSVGIIRSLNRSAALMNMCPFSTHGAALVARDHGRTVAAARKLPPLLGPRARCITWLQGHPESIQNPEYTPF